MKDKFSGHFNTGFSVYIYAIFYILIKTNDLAVKPFWFCVQVPTPLESTEVVMVTEVGELMELCDTLREVKEFAVDLEVSHPYHESHLGAFQKRVWIEELVNFHFLNKLCIFQCMW